MPRHRPAGAYGRGFCPGVPQNIHSENWINTLMQNCHRDVTPDYGTGHGCFSPTLTGAALFK